MHLSFKARSGYVLLPLQLTMYVCAFCKSFFSSNFYASQCLQCICYDMFNLSFTISSTTMPISRINCYHCNPMNSIKVTSNADIFFLLKLSTKIKVSGVETFQWTPACMWNQELNNFHWIRICLDNKFKSILCLDFYPVKKE